jgi:hypothetical protein
MQKIEYGIRFFSNEGFMWSDDPNKICYQLANYSSRKQYAEVVKRTTTQETAPLTESELYEEKWAKEKLDNTNKVTQNTP